MMGTSAGRWSKAGLGGLALVLAVATLAPIASHGLAGGGRSAGVQAAPATGDPAKPRTIALPASPAAAASTAVRGPDGKALPITVSSPPTPAADHAISPASTM